MKTKIGLISFAHMHSFSYANALNMNLNSELIGVFDDNIERGKRYSSEFNAKLYDSAQRLIDDSDAVIVTTENVKHTEYVVQALETGKTVLCEKPLMITIDDGKLMLEALKKTNAKLFTAFPCRFSPAYQLLYKKIHNGDIGDVKGVCGTNRGKCPFDWFVDLRLAGGGAMMDHTVHVADLLRHLLNSEPVSVFAETTNGMNHSDFDDCALVNIKFQNGVFASIDASWSRPKSWQTWGDVTMNVVGEKGVIELDMFNQKSISYSDDKMNAIYNHWGSDIDYNMISALIDAINGIESDAAKLLATGYDGYKASEIALAAYQSAEIGKTVQL